MLNIAVILATLLIAGAFFYTSHNIAAGYTSLQESTDHYLSCEVAANDLMKASNYLTNQARLFATTGDVSHLENYFIEADVSQRRDQAYETLRDLIPGSDGANHLQLALLHSKQLQDSELYAMKLVVRALGTRIDGEFAQQQLDSVPFEEGDESLTPDELLAKARNTLSSEAYELEINTISSYADNSLKAIRATLSERQQEHASRLENLLFYQQVIAAVLIVIVLIAVLLIVFTIITPLRDSIKRISQNRRMTEKGAYELRFLARSYNEMYDASQVAHDKLLHEAEHDALTGLYNRGAFEKLLEDACQHGPVGLIFFDVDCFKEINDQFGHDAGDLVLKKVANLMTSAFRSSDSVCRAGGDEFAIIMNGATPELKELITRKISHVSQQMRVSQDGEPEASISVGVAFGDDGVPSDQLFKNADLALYRVKENGRNGIAFDGEQGRATTA